MTKRCSICDFSPELNSIYHEGLVTSDRPFTNKITKKTKEGDPICDHCAEEIRVARL